MKDIKVLGLDLDGTLVTMKLDFKNIKDEMGIPINGDALSHIQGLPDQEAKRIAEFLESKEREAAEKAELTAGASELLDYCRMSGIKVVVITRNSEESTKRTLEVLGIEVDMVVSREHAEPKPSPKPIELVLQHYNLKPHEMGYAGDYIYDIQAGNSAGVKTVLITSHEHAEDWAPMADYVAEDLLDLLDYISGGNR